MLKTLAIIPARYDSTRFPGKPLVDIGGKSMIRRVYEQALAAGLTNKVVVATNDQRIFDHVQDFNGEVMMTDKSHQSGTDRCAEVAEKYADFGLVLNVQGDEPFIPPAMIDELIRIHTHLPGHDIYTLLKKINKPEELLNTNVVKGIVDQNGQALYFSRLPIPYQQGVEDKDYLANHSYFKHIGIYLFRRDTLLNLSKLPIGKLEKAEKLEQLRWLEHGYSIGTGITTFESKGIDTPEDLEEFI